MTSENTTKCFKELFETALEECTDLECLLTSLTNLALEKFSADLAFGFLSSSLESEDVFFSLDEESLRSWKERGLHEECLEYFHQRQSPVSFSPLTWPFTRLEPKVGSGIRFPREYALAFPILSEIVIGGSQQSNFSGYVVLFFNSFPDFDSSIVEEITSLPKLLSETFLAHRNLRRVRVEKEYTSYAHDIKHYLLLAEEYLHRLRKGTAEQKERALTQLTAIERKISLRTTFALLAGKERNGQLEMRPLPVPLVECLADVIDPIKPLFESRNLPLELEQGPEELEVVIDPAIFPSVLQTLLDNALRYHASDTPVIVRSGVVNDKLAEIQVESRGGLIPFSEEDAIFQKYVRGTNAEGKPGTGLGLFLARTIVEAHGGTLELSENTSEKTLFSVRVPSCCDSLEGDAS